MDGMFRPVGAESVDAVCALIDARIAWMEERGAAQWNAEDYRRWYPREYFASAAAAGCLYALVSPDGEIMAAACLHDADEWWNDGAVALYVHNLAASPACRGAGREFLRHAAGLAVRRGVTRLRLDCNDSSEPLNRWYENQGFRALGPLRAGVYRGVKREKTDLPGTPLAVNVLLFDGFTALDAFGPAEVLERLPGAQLRFVSARGGVVTGGGGVRVVTEAAAIGCDVLLVPGGMGTRTLAKDAEFLALLRTLSDKATYCLSVCTGSALLASCGALDGRRATSNKRAFAWAVSTGARVLWQPRARWTVDGRFYTSSGISAGIDMALGFVCDRLGRGAADEIARALEYRWNDDAAADPFAARE